MKVLALLAVGIAPAAGFVAPQFNGKVLAPYVESQLESTPNNNNGAMAVTQEGVMGGGQQARRVANAAVYQGGRMAKNTPVKNVNQNDPFAGGGVPIPVQGGSLKTWSFEDPSVQRAQVMLATQGRPLSSKVELWQGPDNSPYKVDVYLEDGNLRPFKAMIELPGGSNTIAVKNEGHLEFPIAAKVEPEFGPSLMEIGTGRFVQGGAVYTTPFEPQVQSVKLCLQTDGRPMTARIELMQGPYNDKQVMEIYTEDGMERPFICVIETPGVGNVVRIVNTATVEFPLRADVQPYEVDAD